jgi:cell shape-determining protein MreC
MIYHQRDNRRRRRKGLGIIAWAIGIILCIGLLSWLSPHLFTGSLQFLGRPFFAVKGIAQNAGSGIVGFFTPKSLLLRENADLKQQAALLKAVQIERDVFKAENRDLQELLGRIPADHRFAVATILAKPGISAYDTVVIDGGRKAGMAEGNLVLADNNVVVGYISSVYAYSATVSLYSSPDEKLTVHIGNQALEATAIGKGAGNFEIRLPRNAGVAVGDSVLLSTSTQKILGSVEVINTTPADSFEQILFKGPVDVARLRFLLVEIE